MVVGGFIGEDHLPVKKKEKPQVRDANQDRRGYCNQRSPFLLIPPSKKTTTDQRTYGLIPLFDGPAFEIVVKINRKKKSSP